MAFEAANPRLFGFDLGRLTSGFRQGLEGMMRWPALAWLSPSKTVHVMWPDGSAHVCRGTSFEILPEQKHADFRALVLPGEIALSHAVRLPQLARADIIDALELQLQSLSPLPVDEIVWGWRVDKVLDDALDVTVAFAPRSHVDGYLDRMGVAGEHSEVEVWVDGDGPVVIDGFGETRRMRAQRSSRRSTLSLLALALVLVTLLSVVHFWQVRARVLNAQAEFAALQSSAAPHVSARDSLIRANERAKSISVFLERQPDVPWLLKTLTELLPDSAWLVRLDLDGRTVRIAGQAADAAGLMEALRAHAGISQLRALSPISRGRDGLDTFSFAFEIAASRDSQ